MGTRSRSSALEVTCICSAVSRSGFLVAGCPFKKPRVFWSVAAEFTAACWLRICCLHGWVKDRRPARKAALTPGSVPPQQHPSGLTHGSHGSFDGFLSFFFSFQILLRPNSFYVRLARSCQRSLTLGCGCGSPYPRPPKGECNRRQLREGRLPVQQYWGLAWAAAPSKNPGFLVAGCPFKKPRRGFGRPRNPASKIET